MSNQANRYQHYLLNDFIWDDYFRSWVIEPSEDTMTFWRKFIIENPGQLEAIEVARQVILGLKVQEPEVGQEEVDDSISKVLAALDAPNTVGSAKNNRRVISLSFAYRAAAFFIIILAIALIVRYNSTTSKQSVETAFGNLKKVVLPDSSTVVLNAHSKITFKKEWHEDEPRELWLDGEAFFKVRHIDTDNKISPEERFIVHAKDVTVEVLGTSFDVRQRRSETAIVLESGKIRVSFKDGKRLPITMVPGQIVTISPHASTYITQSTINSSDYSAWTSKRLVLNKGSLKGIIQYLEDNYGKRIVIEDTSLYRRQFQGMLMLDNLDDALFVLSKVLDVNIVKQNDTIFFKPK
jgi:transmembrane sensor